MIFLDIVKEVRLLSGMQGTGPASVVSATGVEELLVKFAVDAYIDIQNYREEWDFLIGKKTFNTIAGKDEYTPSEIFGVTYPDFKKYNTDSFIITVDGKKSYLKEITREAMEVLSMNNDTTKAPTTFAIDPMDNSLIFEPIPDVIYSISFRYWKNPEILSVDTQVPTLPTAYHLLIVYNALQKLSVYLSAPELFSEYATATAILKGQLMRMYIPKMTLKARPLV